jgi:hypothetical protein
LDRLPAGLATVIFFDQRDSLQSRTVEIHPDTQWSIDFRSLLDVVYLDDLGSKGFIRNVLSETERKLFSTPVFSNAIQSVYLVLQKWERYIYDAEAKQILSLPEGFLPEKIGRAQENGEYVLFNLNQGVLIYDRYARNIYKPTHTMHYDIGTFTWEWTHTTITQDNNSVTLDGTWWPLAQNYITDGQMIGNIE